MAILHMKQGLLCDNTVFVLVDDQCKLYCKAPGYNYYYAMDKEVIDGTRCNKYSKDVCVQGNCVVGLFLRVVR